MKRVFSILSSVSFMIFFGCKPVQAESIVFCPEENEAEARETLAISNEKSITLRGLLDIAEQNGLKYEQKKIDIIPRNCDASGIGDEFIAYIIFGGFNDDRTYKKTYLVIANSLDSNVEIVDKQHMYMMPKIFK